MNDCRNMSQIFLLHAVHTICSLAKSTLHQIDPLRVASASAIERSQPPASQKNTCSAKGLDHIGGDLVAHERRGAESKPLLVVVGEDAEPIRVLAGCRAARASAQHQGGCRRRSTHPGAASAARMLKSGGGRLEAARCRTQLWRMTPYERLS
jgi:hypothetical protein